MFIIWYLLFSFFYLTTLVLYYFFCKTLKFNDSLFNILFSKISKFFYFIDITKAQKNKNTLKNVSNLSFKELYTELNFFSNNYLPDFKKALTFSILLSSFLKSNMYFKELNFLFIFFYNKRSIISSKSMKKTNLSYFSNIVYNSNKPKYVASNHIIENKSKFLSFDAFIYKPIKNFIIAKESFSNPINLKWIVKYSPSNFIKYINFASINSYNILYLRKNKVFNKGRYSRNRQYYRTGVYWCLYINIIAVIGIYFWFYRFTINFGYLWWLLFAFICSFVVPKGVKYSFFNPIKLAKSLLSDLVWVSHLYLSVSTALSNFSIKLLNFVRNYVLNFYFFKKTFRYSSYPNLFFSWLFIFISKQVSYIFNFNINSSSVYVWEFNNTNYYYPAIIKSRPVVFERSKHFIKQFFYFIYSK